MSKIKTLEYQLCNEILDVLEKYTHELDPKSAIKILTMLTTHLSHEVFQEQHRKTVTFEE